MNFDAKDLLVKLINCKSVTPNDDGALSVIENALNANNFKCERLIFGSGDEKVQKLRILHSGKAFLRALTPFSEIKIFLRISSYLVWLIDAGMLARSIFLISSSIVLFNVRLSNLFNLLNTIKPSSVI